LQHGKEHQIFGIRAIIEAIQGTTVDKVYIQKMRVAIDEGLNESDEARNINFSYVPVEKTK
jgi:hypothetical protein